ncbi:MULTISPECIES: hypothetical protein [unclassified Pseudofrankia]|uniref:hypothetical protein n=1 Tax=unclassified Pseudofrankia TaxID=2994372 RepID=UPI0008DA2A8D|nr:MULTISPECIES: hypothetical protein [unclassified Pseudofrankia]MDT3440126.1 hypothetical protein [Pseudofrankia sp. BMG5.37]OHV44733.1 hypothetical protein BCD48_24975 [Pseudofrankia sp. BMG5.36]
MAAGFFLVWDRERDGELQVDEMHASFAFDIDDEKQVTVFADNVFIGRVIGRVGSRTEDGLEVQFKVKVLENIKGALPAEVTVNQQGGYDPAEKRLVVFAGDLPLSSGRTYIFSTRYSKDLGFHTLVPRSGDINVTELPDSALKKEISRRRGVVESVAGLKAPK